MGCQTSGHLVQGFKIDHSSKLDTISIGLIFLQGKGSPECRFGLDRHFFGLQFER